MTKDEAIALGYVPKSSLPTTAEEAKAAGYMTQDQAKWKKNKAKWGDFAKGAKVSGYKLGYGLRDIADNWLGIDSAGIGDEQRDKLEEMKIDARASGTGWGKGGEVATDIASFLVPGTIAAKGAMGLNVASKLPFLVPLAAESLAGGAVAGARLPEEGETRGKNALKEVAGNLAGGVVGKSVGDILHSLKTGIKLSDQGKELQRLDPEGVYTPGQLSEGSVLPGLENLASIYAVASQTVQKAKTVGHGHFGKTVMRQAAPNPEGITKFGQKGFDQLSKQTNAGYRQAWKNITTFSPARAKALSDIADMNKLSLGDESAAALSRVSSQAQKLAGVGDLQELDRIIRREVTTAMKTDNHALFEALRDMKIKLRRAIPPGQRKKLGDMDRLYPKYLVAQKASILAKQDQGLLRPRDAISASGTVTKSDDKVAAGHGVLQQIGNLGADTVGKKDAPPALDFFKRIAPMVTGTPTDIADAGGRMMLGQTKAQQLMPDVADIPDWLKELLLTGTKAAGLEKSQDF